MRWHCLIGLLLLPIVCDAQPLENSIRTDTSMMGTPDQPTIEGGLINQSEKDQRTFALDSKCLKAQKTSNVEAHTLTQNIADEFSSDQKIQSLLMAATEDHKLAYVLQKAHQMNLPATVALIPMVESHYKTDAVSPKAARGAWQLMPATAKDYGLKREDRKNFTLSTDTALQLLKNLHQEFGNWALAFAAYNAGSQRVSRALYQHPHAQFIDELGLPLETQHYIYRLKTLYQAIVKYSAVAAIASA